MKRTIFLLITALTFTTQLFAQELVFSNPIQSPRDFVVDGSTLYIGGQFEGDIQRVDLNNPNNTAELLFNDENLNVYSIALNDNDLYFIARNNTTNEFAVYKIDVSISNPTAELIYENSDDIPTAVEIEGDYLYVAHLFGGEIIRKDIVNDTDFTTILATDPNDEIFAISDMQFVGTELYLAREGFADVVKYDLAQTNPAIEEITPFDIPNSLKSIHIDDQFLYLAISEGLDPDQNVIKRYDLTDLDAGATIIVNGLFNPHGLEKFGDLLLIGERNGNRIKTFNSQNEEVENFIHGLGQNGYMLKDGNDLYISEATRIVKLDVTNPSLGFTEIASGIQLTRSIAIYNNELYYLEERGDNPFLNKIDLADPNLTPQPIIPNQGAEDFVINNDLLYFCIPDIPGGGGNVLGYIDLNDVASGAQIITTSIVDPTRVHFHNGDLYVMASFNDRIHVIRDVTTGGTTVETLLDNPNDGLNFPRDFNVHNNNLVYISSDNTFQQYFISQLDLSDENASPELLVTDASNSWLGALSIQNDELYTLGQVRFTQTYEIYSYPNTLSITSFDDKSFKIYPNPVSDVLHIQNPNNAITIKNIQIIDLQGRVIRNIKNNEVVNPIIDMSNLSNGMYVLKINNTKGIKFIKN